MAVTRPNRSTYQYTADQILTLDHDLGTSRKALWSTSEAYQVVTCCVLENDKLE